MRKKVVALLLTAGMIMGSLSGCGQEKQGAKVSEESKTSSVTETKSEAKEESVAEDEEPYVIKYYANQNIFEDDAKVFEEANKYILEKIGCTVEFINISPSEYNEKMKMIFASGEVFDLCFTASSANFTTNVANGVYLPLEELLPVQGKDIYELTPDYYFDTTTVDGHIYALPYLKDAALLRLPRVKAYFVEKYNIDMDSVKTSEDLTPILQTIKDNEPEYVPMLIKSNDTLFGKTMPYEMISGTSVLGFDMTGDFSEIINVFETEESLEFMKLMREWNQKGFFPADVETLTTLGDYNSSGLFAAQVVTYNPGAEVKTKEAVSGTDKVYDYAMNFEATPYLPTSNLFGAGMAISANSPNPEKTMEFINLINTDSYLRNLLAYGIEGEHYEVAGENLWKLPEGVEKQADTGYAPSTWTQGNSYILKVQDTNALGADYWETYKAFNESATPSGALGFVFNAENVTTELAAISNVYNEFAPSLLTGAVDPEEVLPQFLEKLDAVGLEAVMEEANRQYSEWKASK